MRKIVLISAIALAVWAKSAYAAPNSLTASALPASGAAPLAVTFSAGGDGVAFHWQFGDGTIGFMRIASADGELRAWVVVDGERALEDRLEQASPGQRRRLLDAARQSQGLASIEELEDAARREAAAPRSAGRRPRCPAQRPRHPGG